MEAQQLLEELLKGSRMLLSLVQQYPLKDSTCWIRHKLPTCSIVLELVDASFSHERRSAASYGDNADEDLDQLSRRGDSACHTARAAGARPSGQV